MEDRIRIQGLKLETVIGVPDEEREASQLVAVDVEIVPANRFDQLNDEIDGTVDYFEVTQALKRVAGKGERKLIETLADDLAKAVLGASHSQPDRLGQPRRVLLAQSDQTRVCRCPAKVAVFVMA